MRRLFIVEKDLFMKKFGVLHALITAIIYTILYALLLLAGPGPGFQASIIATFNFKAILLLFVVAFTIYPIFYGLIYLFSSIIAGFMKTQIFTDDESYIKTCCGLAVTIAAFATALGFVF